jgi:hypothetical protein
MNKKKQLQFYIAEIKQKRPPSCNQIQYKESTRNKYLVILGPQGQWVMLYSVHVFLTDFMLG